MMDRACTKVTQSYLTVRLTAYNASVAEACLKYGKTEAEAREIYAPDFTPYFFQGEFNKPPQFQSPPDEEVRCKQCGWIIADHTDPTTAQPGTPLTRENIGQVLADVGIVPTTAQPGTPLTRENIGQVLADVGIVPRPKSSSSSTSSSCSGELLLSTGTGTGVVQHHCAICTKMSLSPKPYAELCRSVPAHSGSVCGTCCVDLAFRRMPCPLCRGQLDFS